MERLGRWLRLQRRKLAGLMVLVLTVSAIGLPVPVMGSDVWPQKSTAPYYCLDGGKGWKSTDRYEIYQYDTLPAPLTEVQAKRLFWAYPSNWNALKEAAAKYDPELYNEIASTSSSPNIVKRVKDQTGTKFAWIADNLEIEARAIAALEKVASENESVGKEVPELLQGANSEETAVSFTLPALDGPGVKDTELDVGSAFIQDIVSIEPQSVWDNGSTGGNEGWLDASQDNNIAKGIMGEDLYEVTWSGNTIRIHNNGSMVASKNLFNQEMSDEEKYNKTKVRYKITMRADSGWYSAGMWDADYLKNWMDFKACTNEPGHQRLYKADIRIVPSDMVFYMVIDQEPRTDVGLFRLPERERSGGDSAELSFQIYRHEETFQSHYHVKLKKVDAETGKPLKGSQFYLYERFEDEEELFDHEENGALAKKNLNITPWSGFQIFAEGTTNEQGEVDHTDTRTYRYSKTYCDGHGSPEWANVEVSETEDSEDKEENEGEEENGDAEGAGSEESRDQNRKAAEEWLDLFESCEEEAENSGGTHFHWEVDENLYDEIRLVAESGEPEDMNSVAGADAEDAFEESGCKRDCERTYQAFVELKYTYTWKEIQARNGYILHGVHGEDEPIHLVTTNSSEAGANAYVSEGSSKEIQENVWYSGNRQEEINLQAETSSDSDTEVGLEANVIELASGRKFIGKNDRKQSPIETYKKVTDSNSGSNAYYSEGHETASNSDSTKITASASDSQKKPINDEEDNWENTKYGLFSMVETLFRRVDAEEDSWEDGESDNGFALYFDSAEEDRIKHLEIGDSGLLSYAGTNSEEQKYWIVRNHRTEGEIHINKRDMDLYRRESEPYDSYGDTEGDGLLEDAVYGLFAAEDIVHPDSDILPDGSKTNTGIVYKRHDLVAVAKTDSDGNADFMTYTVAPGKTFDYELGEVVKRSDILWAGPENLYIDNKETYGNWWIGRPLILGNYYIKELSRSEGYELSINGSSQEWTNYGTTLETPESIAAATGTAVLSMPELSATMESKDRLGNGYDQLSFSVMSSGTTNTELQTNGYELIFSGFPAGTEFYRVDTGEIEVTGPHVTGQEELVIKDENGDIVWKTADTNKSHIKYEPEYSEDGTIIGQVPMSRMEYQTQKLSQIPEARYMTLQEIELDRSQNLWKETLEKHNLEDLSSELFGFLKAEVERVLYQNGYDVPMTANGTISKKEALVFSEGVVRGETDYLGMTTTAGSPAIKTVYGAALQEVTISGIYSNTTVESLFYAILSWYQENPYWGFGGIHRIEMKDGFCMVTVYADVPVNSGKNFFTVKKESGKTEPEYVYFALENTKNLRWEYQMYREDSTYQYYVDKRYSLGSGSGKRYYMDVTLAPAVMMDENGEQINLEHQVMVYHKAGEEIIDYLKGNIDSGYRVPLTEVTDRIEITTELEFVDQDVCLEEKRYDSETGIHTVFVPTNGMDSFGQNFSDEEKSLTLSFMVKLPNNTKRLTFEDIKELGYANVYGYQIGQEIGYAEYLMRFTDASIGIHMGGAADFSDTYIVSKRLNYRGQNRVAEDGNSIVAPVQVLERPIKQKIEISKEISGEEAIENFRFKIYLKSNLERLFCEEDGTITWLNRTGEQVDIGEYKEEFPELVQKLYTKKTTRRILEEVKENAADSTASDKKTDEYAYQYEKFFDAIRTANTDKWDNQDFVWNTSWKPFVSSLFDGIENKINSSKEAKENAKRTDAVRQFAIDWYLEEEVLRMKEAMQSGISYQDEVYDKALYEAILKAEKYLKPFFLYDLDSIYEILWDSEVAGGIDQDFSTLSANQMDHEENSAKGVSAYLPYGDYVVVEQQPYRSEWNDFQNRHFVIDKPKELSLPQEYDGNGNVLESSKVSWSITDSTDPVGERTGYAVRKMTNERYYVKLRIEKLDAETGEPILHDDAVFALYKAERNEDKDGDGSIKRYQTDTIVSGSRLFLEAMGATHISTFARLGNSLKPGIGLMYTGIVSAGTPICLEENGIVFADGIGLQQGTFSSISTLKDTQQLQNVGYVETPEPIEAGVYVLAEVKVPAGYVRSKPIPVEVYSDRIVYYPNGDMEKTAAVTFENDLDSAVGSNAENSKETIGHDTARIYVHDKATSLEVSKIKTPASYSGMKLSGRVEGSIVELDSRYGLENLELGYNSSGTYLGFGWKKGFLEYLENRKAAGERIQIVYENGVFQGYGYLTRTLDTADDAVRYVAGAQMALFEAIELRRSGDTEDFAYEGLEVSRDRNGHVSSMIVKEGFAGERSAFVELENGRWGVETVKRQDTPVLYYDLSNLKVMETDEDGKRFGYDRDGHKMRITFDTKSIYAVRNGQAVFELTGGELADVVYDSKGNAFTELPENTVIYHLDENLCRDAQVDGYTGLAYVERTEIGARGNLETFIYVWPVTELRDQEGRVYAREKILTGRPGEKNEGTENAYITGTMSDENGVFEKRMNPNLDERGLVVDYPASDIAYKNGEMVYDRDGEYLGYRYDGLLSEYNKASYDVKEHEEIYDAEVVHREGEAWIIPNLWTSGQKKPQDAQDLNMTTGQADLLRRVVPGTYIMEELKAPAGYVRSLPTAVCVEESAEVQRETMSDEKIKIEIAKIDGTENYKKSILSEELSDIGLQSVEFRGGYTETFVENAELALYKAKRVITSDYTTYPKGYYLVKAELTPAQWYVESSVDNEKVLVEAVWITDGTPKYFEGIPAGDYILEERWTPEGYLPSSMEILVQETEELQSFILKDDHTKLEVFKYEEGKNGVKAPLTWPAEAELALYPAVLDSHGDAIIQNGQYFYEENQKIASWTTGNTEEYEKITEVYERMYWQYGYEFDRFSWEIECDGRMVRRSADLEESLSTGNREVVRQIWELSDGSKLRVTVGSNGDGTKLESDGRPRPSFEYQFQCRESESSDYSEVVSYNFLNGLHRLDRIPVGTYILVETRVPDGYETCEPKVVVVKETGQIQRVYMENRRDEQGEPDNPEEPTKPVEPDNPEEPTKPGEPDNPEEPTKPEESDNPEEPTKPEESDNPEEPTRPTEPDNPEESTKPDASDDSESPEDPEQPILPTPIEPEITETPELPDNPVKRNRYGYIKAIYEPDLKKRGAVRLLYPSDLEQLVIPETGETPAIFFLIIGMFLSLTGFIWFSRKKEWGERK